MKKLKDCFLRSFLLRSWIVCVLVLGSSHSALASGPYAFVSLSDPTLRAVRVFNLNSMAVETTLSNVGDEPSRMVISPDGNTIYVSSWKFNGSSANQKGMIYAIDVPTRMVKAQAEVGRSQNRAVAISPDGSAVYTWKGSLVSGSLQLALVALNSTTLVEIAAITLPSTCVNLADILAHPDGRVFIGGCSGGLHVFSPGTGAVTLVAATPFIESLLGFSPDGGEIYYRNIGTAQILGPTSGNTNITAMDISSGSSNDFVWNVSIPNGTPLYPTNSRVLRMVSLPLSNLPAGEIAYLFSYSGNDAAPIAMARASDLAPIVGSRVRQLVEFKNLGEIELIGALAGQTIALGGRSNTLQRIDLTTANGSFPISALGAAVPQIGVSNLSDIVLTNTPPELIFANGFE